LTDGVNMTPGPARSAAALRVLLGGSLDGQALDKDPIGSSGQLR